MPNTRLYWLHTLSPTHAGIGRGVGYIDLPIDRDGVTGWPIIRGSGFKGVWADHYRATEDARRNDHTLRAAFGVAGDNNNSNAGALIPTDARLVCLPVRSFRGTFAWATSNLCLNLLHRTLKTLNPGDLPTVIPAPKEPDENATTPGQALTVGQTLVESGGVYLEDMDFKAVTNDPSTQKWAEFIAKSVFHDDSAWQDQFKKRFVVLPDSAFDFLCETGTEVHTRVRIDDEMKVVANGHLWTEESLPAETILMGVIQCDRVFQKEIDEKELLKQFTEKELHLQIGGKATVGRGQVRCVFTEVM